MPLKEAAEAAVVRCIGGVCRAVHATNSTLLDTQGAKVLSRKVNLGCCTTKIGVSCMHSLSFHEFHEFHLVGVWWNEWNEWVWWGARVKLAGAMQVI